MDSYIILRGYHLLDNCCESDETVLVWFEQISERSGGRGSVSIEDH